MKQSQNFGITRCDIFKIPSWNLKAKKKGQAMTLISKGGIESNILLIRAKRVMLDRDLARLYGVKTKALNQAVKRNIERFPEDFMFELTKWEFQTWRSQFVTSKADRKGLRYAPMAFTEQGVAMLSSVLHSKKAIQVNIAIMRVFVKIKEIISVHKEFAHKPDLLERKIEKHDKEIHSIFEAIRRLMAPPEKPKRRIGFKAG